MNISFEGKVALVTGAGSGMGLATAKAFAEEKAAVGLADVQEKPILAAAEELVAAGHKALAIPCDVSDDVQVEAMVTRTVAEFGRLDAAFNNAGVMARIAPTANSTPVDWDRVIGINLRAVWTCMRYELLQMERQGRARSSSLIGLAMSCCVSQYFFWVSGKTRTQKRWSGKKQTKERSACFCPSPPSVDDSSDHTWAPDDRSVRFFTPSSLRKSRLYPC